MHSSRWISPHRVVEEPIVGAEARDLGLVAFLIGEAVERHRLGEPRPKLRADRRELPADRRLARAELLRDRLAGTAVEDPQAKRLEGQHLALGLDLADRRDHLRAEHRRLEGLVRLRLAARGGHEVLEARRAAAVVPLRGEAAIEFVAEGVPGDRKQPRAEAGAARRVVAVDVVRDRRERLLREVPHRLDTDVAAAPTGELGADDRSEGLPEFEPRRLVPLPEAVDEGRGEGMHGHGRWAPAAFEGDASHCFGNRLRPVAEARRRHATAGPLPHPAPVRKRTCTFLHRPFNPC